MKLSQLIPEALIGISTEIADIDVNSLHDDSRQVGPGDLFFAIEGFRSDGHRFIPQVIEAGAAAVIGSKPKEDALKGITKSVPYIQSEDIRQLFGLAAARFYQKPFEYLKTIGITGTNGKTTTSYLLEGILKSADIDTGLIGTVAYRYQNKTITAPYTTPTPLELQSLAKEMVDANVTHLIMEVSSHGLDLGRVWGASYNIAAFSHLTQDHLDLHGSMEDYLAAKLLLFTRHLKPGGTAIIHRDGAYADRVIECVKNLNNIKLITCSALHQSDIYLSDIETSLNGISGNLHFGKDSYRFQSPLLGSYNAENIILAVSMAYELGISPQNIISALRHLKGVAGRVERVDSGSDGFAVLVDYAHTPDAIKRALEAMRALSPKRLIVLLGCGGDRDKEKRPLMGQAAALGADHIIVTSDNPRSEDADQIIADILPGLAQYPPEDINVISDRKEAIAFGVNCLRKGDILLIAGKGHETYQIIGDQKFDFDDRKIAAQFLAKKEASNA